METFKPIPLAQSNTYPTFQLIAEIRPRIVDADTALLIAVLETFEWLRERFIDVGIVSELDLPSPADYSQASLDMLDSFVINSGYTLEVIWLKEHGAWTLKLTEPDQGLTRDFPREPVPGRLFDTSISYSLRPSGSVKVGIKIEVTDISHDAPECEVIRPAVVKRLCRNPQLGLWQGLPLTDKAHHVDTKDKADHCCRWLKDDKRTMAAVLYFQPDETDSASAGKSLIMGDGSGGVPNLLQSKTETFLDYSGSCIPKPRIEMDALARYRMGWAHYCIVPAAQRNRFNQIIPGDTRDGDVVVVLPKGAGYPKRPLHFPERDVLKRKAELDCTVAEHCRAKQFDWEQIIFVDEARELRQRALTTNASSIEELRANYEIILREEQQKYQTDKANLQYQITGLNEKNESLKAECASLQYSDVKIDDSAAHKLEQLERTLMLRDREIEHLNLKLSHPCSLGEVGRWAEEYFSSEITMLPRAKNELDAVSNSGLYDIGEICEAIEYLAREYRDCTMRVLTEDEANNRCAALYGRPFSVTFQSEAAIHEFRKDYHVQYCPGHGHPREDWPLNLHLRRGSGTDLIRIYFFWDSVNNKVIIGSLPEHLRTTRDPK